MTATIGSGIMLSTIGSIPLDIEADVEQDLVEMENIRKGLGMDIGIIGRNRSARTIVVDDDGEETSDGHGHRSNESPAPAYHSLEMGFRAARGPSFDEADIRRIRVDVETTTSTI